MSEHKKKIHAWCVLDNKAGHRSQTMGLLQCLQSHYSIDVRELRFNDWTRPIGRMLQNVWPIGTRLADMGLARPITSDDARPDLIVGSGGGVQWAIAALAKKYDAYSIYLGSPRKIPVADYGQVLHYVPELSSQGVTLIPMMPGPISPAIASTAWDTFQQQHSLQSGTYASCLVGGDGSGYAWGSADGVRLGQRMNEVYRNFGMRWLITTSRRTPSAMEQAIRETLLSEAIADACWAGLGDDRRVVAAYLGASSQVLVSEDSMSMVQEALASSHNVSLFGSEKWTANQRHEQFLQSASAHQWLQRISLSDDAAAHQFFHNQKHYQDDLQAVVANAVMGRFSRFLEGKSLRSRS